MVSAGTESYRLKLLGSWDLTGPGNTVVRSLLAQPRRLCLLAYLALNGEPVGRARIVALFWPESDEERARNALNQAVHYLRRSLSKDAVQTVEGDRLWVPPGVVWFDVRCLLQGGPECEDHTPTGDSEGFFEGWNADDSQPLQEWLDGVRTRVAQRLSEARVEPGKGEPAATEAVTVSLGSPRDAEPGVTKRVVRKGPARGGGIRSLFVGATLVLAVFAGGLAWSSGRDGPPAPGPGLAEVAVLLPSVFYSGDAPAVSADHIHDELVASLSRAGGARIRSLRTMRTVADLKESLEALGAESRPDWAVTLTVRVVDGHARVIGMLLRGPDYSETPASPDWDYPVDTDDQALVDLPRDIAAGAAAVFGEWIGGGRVR